VALAPPSAWGEWAAQLTSGEGDRHGGMVSLSMQQGEVDDRPKGHIRATVEPSTKIKDRAGVYVQVNDHYQLVDTEKVSGCEEIIGLLAERFDDSLRRSDWIIDQIMRLKNA
jgi:hypothetical protein